MFIYLFAYLFLNISGIWSIFTIGILNKGCSSKLLISSALRLRKSYKKDTSYVCVGVYLFPFSIFNFKGKKFIK